MERLKHRREFLRAAGSGRKWVAPGLILQVCPHISLDAARCEGDGVHAPGEARVRFGLTVSRKVGGAVTRNRVRRRLRAVAEAVLPAHAEAGYDYVLIGRAATAGRPYGALVADLEEALKRVKVYRDGAADGRDIRTDT